MSYTLEKWDVLISKTIHPDKIPVLYKEPELLQFYTEQSAEEKEKIRQALISDAERGASEAKLQFFVQFNQAILIRLLDKLYHYKKQDDLPEPLLSFYKTIAGHVSFILDFLEEYFMKWLDPNEHIPLRYLTIIREGISLQLAELTLKYKGQQSLTVVDHAFAGFAADPDQSVSYNELLYAKILLKELLSPVYPDHYTLEDNLIMLNFNSFEFLHHLLAGLQERLDATEGIGDKLAFLAAYQKRVRLLTERPGAALYPGHVHVREALLHAMDNEILFLNSFGESGGATGTVVSPANSLVHVPFKGTEIYLLHKSFIDAGGAPSETYKSFLEKTAAHLSNKTKKGFSVESLQKNSDKVDYESKENVKRFLMKMIRNVESY